MQHRHFCAPPRSQPARAFTEAPHRAQRRHKQQCARAHRPQRFADGQHAMVKRSTARAIGAKSRGGATTALETGDGGRATRETYTYSYNLMSLVFTALLSCLYYYDLRLRHTVDTIVHRPRTMLPRRGTVRGSGQESILGGWRSAALASSPVACRPPPTVPCFPGTAGRVHSTKGFSEALTRAAPAVTMSI